MEDFLRNILQKIDFFAGLTDNEMDYVAKHLNYSTYGADLLICREGDVGNEFFIILSGRVSVFKTDQGEKDCEIVQLKAGATFGEMSLIDEMSRSASVSAIDETKVATLSRDSLNEMKLDNIKVYSQILFNLVKAFSSRLRNMDERYMKLIHFFF